MYFSSLILPLNGLAEISIANNSTSDHSVTSGAGPDDPMSGKLFNTGIIKPKGFIDYVPEKVTGQVITVPSLLISQIKGQLIVVANK